MRVVSMVVGGKLFGLEKGIKRHNFKASRSSLSDNLCKIAHRERYLFVPVFKVKVC